MASKSSGANNIVGYRYFFSIHMGLSRGPLDELVEIRVGDLTAWKGSETANTEFLIDAPNLFGGEEKEGGIKGTLAVLMGEPDQIVQPWIKDQLGGLVPDFRGTATLYYDGLVTVNNPYPKQWKMRIRRATKGWHPGTEWYLEKAVIELVGSDGTPVKAMNAAHIVYECATNPVWGRGLPPAALDLTAFQTVADTLYAEQLGLCLRWNRQEDLDKFVQTVMNHIGGAIYIDRKTGLLTMSLTRGGYDIEALPIFDYTSGLLSISEDQSATADNLFNEIIVKWHDPITDNDGQIRAHNLASIQSLGVVVSTTVDYLGLPTASLAARIAQRDLEVNSTDLRRLKLKLDRRGIDIAPGGLFRVNAPDYGLQGIVLRAAQIVDSDLTDGSIEISALQDIFSLPALPIVLPEPGGYVPPVRVPTAVSDRLIEEVTYRDLIRWAGFTDLSALPIDAGAIKTFAKRPAALAVDYEIATSVGGGPFQSLGRNSWEATAVLSDAIDTYDTAITIEAGSDTGTIVVGQSAIIGTEIVRIDSIDPMIIARGCVDTIPVPHLANERIWFETALPVGDGKEYSAGELVAVKLLTRTNSQKLAEADAPTDFILIDGRQGRPYPPGNFRINGVPFADVVAPVGGAITFAWAHRDRLTQSDFLLEHEAGSTGPEAGTTYTIRLYDGSTLFRTTSGITGTSWVYTNAMSIADGNVPIITIELESVRDGFVSWQIYSKIIERSAIGFDNGFNYNFNGGI